jgi:hypothetical protein
MIIREDNILATVVRRLIFVLIGGYCLFCAIYQRLFAKIHIQLPFLDFPIFLSEILLAASFLGILYLYCRGEVRPVNKWVWVGFGGLAVFLAVKIGLGYIEYPQGWALGLRHAALFYYSFFALIGYQCFRRNDFCSRLSLFLVVVFIITKIYPRINPYYILPYLSFSFILIRIIKNRWLQLVLIVATIFYPSFYGRHPLIPFDYLFFGSRSRVLGHIGAVIFLSLAYWMFISQRKMIRLIVLPAIGSAIIAGIIFSADRHAVQSMSSFSKVRQYLIEIDETIQSRGQNYDFQKLPTKLYSEEETTIVGISKRVLREINPVLQEEDAEGNVLLKEKISDIKENEAKKIEEKKNQLKMVKQKLDRLKEIELDGHGDATDYVREAGVEDDKLNQTEKVKKELDKKQGVEPVHHEDVTRLSQQKAFTGDDRMPLSDEVIQQEIAKVGDLLVQINQEQGSDLVNLVQIEDVLANMDGADLGDIVNKLDHVSTNVSRELFASKNERVNQQIKQVLTAASREDEMTIEGAMYIGKERYQFRALDTAYTNIAFRYFIWRDMLREVRDERAFLFGVNFARPQRSRSIEILGWARSEWGRDGWITPHNSYLHYFYRGGIVGLAFLGALFYVVFTLIRDFIRLRSVPGIFLMAIFVYWLILANFLVFFEFPYNAIPFWTLLGMTIAYCRRLQDNAGGATRG